MWRLFSIAIILAFTVPGGINPQSKKITERFFPDPAIEINTPAFQKKKGFTTYDEMMAYLTARQERYADRMAITFIGTSQKGYKIPMVTLAAPNNSGNPDNDKVRIWMQGGLHGNEPGSTEGVLMLLDHLLADSSQHYLFDRLTIRMVPMANIDGYEKQDRYAANGLDLNRDQTKLVAPESQALKRAYSDYAAEVALDFHEYRPYRKDYARLSTYGVTAIYDVMFLYSGNLNVPDTLRHFTQQQFVNPCKAVMQAHQLRHHDYFSSTKVLGEIHLKQSSNNARSSATSFALAEAVSTLIEVRGVGLERTSFKRRVHTAFLVGMSYLESAYTNHLAVKETLALSRQQQQPAIVKSKPKAYDQTVGMIDLDTQDSIGITLPTLDAWTSKPTLERARPAAYLLDSSQGTIAEKLSLLGLQVSRIEADRSMRIEKYHVTDYQQDSQPYEQTYRQSVSTTVKAVDTILSAGTYIIDLRQKNANLAIEVCEPEAPNSFVSFGQIITTQEAILPIYRYLFDDLPLNN